MRKSCPAHFPPSSPPPHRGLFAHNLKSLSITLSLHHPTMASLLSLVPSLDALTLCIPIAGALPFLPHLVKAVYANAKLRAGGKKGYDLKDPRRSVALASDDTPEGRFISRCQGAHQNAFEAFPFFAAAVLVAKINGVAKADLDSSATLFLIVRLLYTVVYMNNTSGKLAMLRSAVWFAGVGICVNLFVMAARAAKPASSA
jgi:uncharacterized MAPEG superfamily protein